MIAVAILVAVWLACGLYAAGTAFAYLQGEYPTIAEEQRRSDLTFALTIGLIGGPCALVALCLTPAGPRSRHGWRLR